MPLQVSRYVSATWAATAVAFSLVAPPTQAAAVLGGAYSLFPAPVSPFGPGDVDLPDTQLTLGSGPRAATLRVDGGTQVTIAYLNGWGNGLNATVATIEGAGTRVNLAANGDTNRFAAGNAASSSSVIVSGGAVLDGTAQRDRCSSGTACQNVVGAAAGSNGALTVAGAGSEAHFLRLFHVGVLSYNGATGARGRDGVGTIKVLDGGLLTTEFANLGAGFTGPNLDGSERGMALATVSGAGSRWVIGGSDVLNGDVRLQAALDRQGVVNIDVNRGGLLHMLASPVGQQTQALLGTGGSFAASVQGAGSTWRIDGDGQSGTLNLASGAGNAGLLILDGGHLDAHIKSLQIGSGGGRGSLQVIGAGSRVTAPDATISVGDAGTDPEGSGWLRVTQGATLSARHIEIGRNGLLSGSGDIRVATLVNRGTINPGDSPGTLRLAGHLHNEPGARLVLEIQADGLGGFAMDQLQLEDSPELDNLAIEFRFLGSTDPVAFMASGLFDIDHFVLAGGAPLADSAFGGVNFSASSLAFNIRDFVYTPASGARFTASQVPLPSTLSLAVLALLFVSMKGRQRPQQNACNKGAATKCGPNKRAAA